MEAVDGVGGDTDPCGVRRSVHRAHHPIRPGASAYLILLVAPTQVINATEYRYVSLSLLSESKTNPRRIFEDAALKELAESIRTQGVLSPLLVRAKAKGPSELP